MGSYSYFLYIKSKLFSYYAKLFKVLNDLFIFYHSVTIYTMIHYSLTGNTFTFFGGI